MSFKAKKLALAAAALVSLPAFALTPGSGTWVKETASYSANSLTLGDTYVYVPKNAAPAVKAGKRALMLSLHGCGQKATAVINNSYNWEPVAEQYGMVVVAPSVPTGRSYPGCWDWFDANHSRTNRDSGPLLKLVEAIKARSGLDIDPNQVYVTGLSSGAGLANTVGCMHPEVFAGIGSNAGPVIGSKNGDNLSEPSIPAATVAANCQKYNGNAYNDWFKTQLWSTVYGGSSDSLNKTNNNRRNAEALRIVYGISSATAVPFTVTGGGDGKMYSDGKFERVSDIYISAMGHAWPAGSTAKPADQYVSNKFVDYPAWVTAWFFKNNMRVKLIGAPANLACGTSTDNSISLTWSAANGATKYNLYRNGKPAKSETTTAATDTGLQPGSYYTYTVTAATADAESAPSNAVQCKTTGAAPALPAPSDARNSASTDTTVTLTWTAVEGAKGYAVYRQNPSARLTTTTNSIVDSALTASTNYSYTVATINADGKEGAVSAAVAAKTTDGWICKTTTASNYAHVSAGRATQNLGYAYAKGSGTKMGLYNTYNTSTLSETKAGYFVVGNCQ